VIRKYKPASIYVSFGIVAKDEFKTVTWFAETGRIGMAALLNIATEGL
jgi:hypothetical protein